MGSIGTTRVEDVMVTAVETVTETEKMEAAAKLFKDRDIHAAPVVNDAGACVGIITSHDIVEYESVRKGIENELSHGSAYDMAHYGAGVKFRLPGQYFDEVGFHMTKTMQTARVDDSVSYVAREMCAKHIHHVLVLDEKNVPIGMLSSLDILGFVTGQPVCRTANCH